MDWKQAIERWRMLSPEERTRIRRDRIPLNVTESKPVPDAADPTPRHTSLAFRQLGAQVSNGLAHGLDLADDRALHHVVRKKHVATAGGKAFGCRDYLQDVREVMLVARAHSGRASARIRSFMRGCSSASVRRPTLMPSASSMSVCNPCGRRNAEKSTKP